mmetsp:Transcript_23467/g.69725  ORF Transcript_23467/g.69725 Transcript_23467/m.69725 type:complete len:389 (-) Transcript_23467:21-1187(-)
MLAPRTPQVGSPLHDATTAALLPAVLSGRSCQAGAPSPPRASAGRRRGVRPGAVVGSCTDHQRQLEVPDEHDGPCAVVRRKVSNASEEKRVPAVALVVAGHHDDDGVHLVGKLEDGLADRARRCIVGVQPDLDRAGDAVAFKLVGEPGSDDLLDVVDVLCLVQRTWIRHLVAGTSIRVLDGRLRRLHARHMHQVHHVARPAKLPRRPLRRLHALVAEVNRDHHVALPAGAAMLAHAAPAPRAAVAVATARPVLRPAVLQWGGCCGAGSVQGAVQRWLQGDAGSHGWDGMPHRPRNAGRARRFAPQRRLGAEGSGCHATCAAAVQLLPSGSRVGATRGRRREGEGRGCFFLRLQQACDRAQDRAVRGLAPGRIVSNAGSVRCADAMRCA